MRFLSILESHVPLMRQSSWTCSLTFVNTVKLVKGPMITMWDFNFIDGKRCEQFFFARGFEFLRMVGSYPMPTRINLRIHLLVVINEYETSNV